MKIGLPVSWPTNKRAIMSNLKEAEILQDVVENKGAEIIDTVKAQLRSELYRLVFAQINKPLVAPLRENMIINELFREYLIFNGFACTASVFDKESFRGKQVTESGEAYLPDRESIARELKLEITDMNMTSEVNLKTCIPIIYGIIESLENSNLCQINDTGEK